MSGLVLKPLAKIGLKVLKCLKPNSKPNKRLPNSGARACLFTDTAMRRGCRMGNDASGVPKVTRAREKRDRAYKPKGPFLRLSLVIGL